VEDGRLQESVLADVGDEFTELGAVDREQREEGGGGVVLELGGWVGAGRSTGGSVRVLL